MARIKSGEEDHDQSNVFREELKADTKVTAHHIVTISKVLQKWGSGKGGSYTWTIWMVQLILEKIVNCMPPAAISLNIAYLDYLDMPRVKVIAQELPIISFIREFRTNLRIIGDTLTVYIIGEVEQWDKLLSDGTGRCQIFLHNLVIGIIDEERLCPLIISTSTILEVETSEHQVDAVLSTIEGCGKWLQRWVEVLEHSNPSYHNYIPYPRSINIGKLGSGGALMSDTCDGKRRMRLIIVD